MIPMLKEIGPGSHCLEAQYQKTNMYKNRVRTTVFGRIT